MNELTNECLTELGVALKRFGTYSFDDKGPGEVMDIDRLVGKLRDKLAKDALKAKMKAK